MQSLRAATADGKPVPFWLVDRPEPTGKPPAPADATARP
jgi:hypothetical protein